MIRAEFQVLGFGNDGYVPPTGTYKLSAEMNRDDLLWESSIFTYRTSNAPAQAPSLRPMPISLVTTWGRIKIEDH